MASRAGERIITILKELIAKDEDIDRSTLIYDDLLISGDDASELIGRIHAEFGTSFKGLHFPDYFPNETESMMFRVYLLFGGKRKRPLTVGHLIEVVERGEWFEA